MKTFLYLSDIHSNFEALNHLDSLPEMQDPDCEIRFGGDYIDGVDLEPDAVIDTLRYVKNLCDSGKAKAILGNHDRFILDAAFRPFNETAWALNGRDDTLVNLGIVYRSPSDLREQLLYHYYDELWEKTLYDGDDYGYVAYTNEGDGSYSMYTNPERTLFLLDDEDIYMDELIGERYSDYSVDAHDDVDGFHLEDGTVTVYYMEPVPGARGHRTNIEYPIVEGKRTIDGIADALADVLKRIMDGYDACQKAWEERKKEQN